MKIAINIILAAIAIVLAINILSNIEKSQVDTIKETFMLERAREFSSVNTYKLIPKNYGDDTIIVRAQNAQVIYEVDELFGDTTTKYYIFISNNKAINAVRGEKYKLQE